MKSIIPGRDADKNDDGYIAHLSPTLSLSLCRRRRRRRRHLFILAAHYDAIRLVFSYSLWNILYE